MKQLKTRVFAGAMLVRMVAALIFLAAFAGPPAALADDADPFSSFSLLERYTAPKWRERLRADLRFEPERRRLIQEQLRLFKKTAASQRSLDPRSEAIR